MGMVSNKNIIMLLRYVIKCVDRSLLEHGTRSAYILYKMLQQKKELELYEIADYAVFITFHDILSYKMKETEELVNKEKSAVKAHSYYGYCFLKELSPFTKEAEAQLNYRNRLSVKDKKALHSDGLESYVFLADWINTYLIKQGTVADMQTLRQYEGIRNLCQEAWDVLEEAVKKEDIFGALEDESYLTELDELLEYLVFSNEDEEKYLNMIIFCMGIKNERYAIDAAVSMCICKEIGIVMDLNAQQQEALKYAALIHDIGMLLLPQELINEVRTLNGVELEKIKEHARIIEVPLRTILPVEIVDIAVAHHERGDGSGYPKKLKAVNMTIMQRILQVADIVSAMIADRPYRKSRMKKIILSILKEGSENGNFSTEVVNQMTQKYDIIIEKSMKKTAKILENRRTVGLCLQENGGSNG